jgi:hypothetical protein
MKKIEMEKKYKLEYIEKEIGLKKLLKRDVIEGMKKKELRKLIKKKLKKVEDIYEIECMLKLLHIITHKYTFQKERFRCDIG